MPVVDLVAALAQQVSDHVLARPSGPRVLGMATKSFVVGELRVEALVDRDRECGA